MKRAEIVGKVAAVLWAGLGLYVAAAMMIPLWGTLPGWQSAGGLAGGGGLVHGYDVF